MEQEIIAMLDECINLAAKLDALLEEDNAAIGTCISGTILQRYKEGNNVARNEVNYLKSYLRLLQDEQIASLLQS